MCVKNIGNILLVSLSLLVLSCSGSRSNDSILETNESEPVSLELADQFWAGRIDSISAIQALRGYEELCAEDTLSIELWTSLSRAYYYLGQFIMEDPIVKDSLFMKGYDASQSILNRNPEYKKLIFSTGDEKVSIQGLDHQYTDILYWGMANYGRWLETKGPLVRLGQRDLIRATLEHIHDLDPNYYAGAYYRYLGALLSNDPESVAEDTTAIRQAFEMAIEQAPDYLANYTFMAEYYCPRVKDKDLFYRLLTIVITSKPDSNLPYYPENEHEKKLADRLMLKAENEAWF